MPNLNLNFVVGLTVTSISEHLGNNPFRNISPLEAASGVRASIQKFLETEKTFLEISQTETVYDQTNITFKYRCPIQYRFDKSDRLKISVFYVKHNTDPLIHRIGDVFTDLSSIIAKGGEVSLPLSPSAAIDLQIMFPDFYSHYVKLRFSGNCLQVRENVPLAAYMALVLKTEGRAILLYKSEVVKDKNPRWKEFAVPLYIIQFYHQGVLQIHCYNQIANNVDSLIGRISHWCINLSGNFYNIVFYTLLISRLLQYFYGTTGKRHRTIKFLYGKISMIFQCSATLFLSIAIFFQLMNFEGKRIHEKMSISLESLELIHGESFFSAIKDGIHLHLTTAVDLTASNGNPNQPDSLHYIHPHTQSPYMNAMAKLTPLFLSYMAHTRVGALGFGARTGPQFELSQCFALSGSHSDPQVNGLSGLLDAYRHARLTVQPFAPTDFSEVIYHVSKRHLGLYFVLLILTDGGLTNPRRTVDAIVDCSVHPISIIAVGIGTGRDFANVKALESPVLKHSDGRQLIRQVCSAFVINTNSYIVMFENFQFIPFEDLDTDDAVALIPLQIAQWHNSQSHGAH
uniref:VWFA domain-containing protein n=1 Tax=Angiostrongylus cantonensis TaxID=6313 RepID=A0A0K0DIR4_ANGCA